MKYDLRRQLKEGREGRKVGRGSDFNGSRVPDRGS